MAAPSVDLALQAYYMQVASQGHMNERLMPNHDLIYSSVQKYYMLASVALLFYDLLTTLDDEIARVWSGKFSSFIVLWTLVSHLCVGLTIASLTELTRNRTAGFLR
jgi:hypothetical protein